MCICTRLSLAEEAVTESDVQEGGGAVISTDQKHYKLLADAIEAASEVTSEKRASKRVRDETNFLIFLVANMRTHSSKNMLTYLFCCVLFSTFFYFSQEITLRRLYKALTQYSASEESNDLIESSLDDTIIPACLFGVSRGTSPAEQYAACRCLESLSIIVGIDRDEYYEAIEESLSRAVMATGRATPVRSAALRALCLTAFISGTDEAATNSLLDLCESVCGEQWRGEDVQPVLRATALDCWALLSTTIEDALIAGGDYGRGLNILPILQQCLDHDSADLRFSAGECVTWIHEARLSLGIADEIAENTTERRYRHGELHVMSGMI